jgi:hypothetical protein
MEGWLFNIDPSEESTEECDSFYLLKEAKFTLYEGVRLRQKRIGPFIIRSA